MEQPLFLGLDLSTQGLKALAIDDSLNVEGEYTVNFDSDLPVFETEGGAHRHDDGVTVTAPSVMWVAALDLLLERMKEESFPFERVVAISGSGQQHGSVWLHASARDALAALDAALPLEEQLKDIFTLTESPIWMDCSTKAECKALEDALGGPQEVADRTGSRAYVRFTGNQIAKVSHQQPNVYAKTDRISLVSSFMASLLVGTYAPIDYSDGSGMNILDIRTKDWHTPALDAVGEGLREKMGGSVASHSAVGGIHQYYVDRYGLNPECMVIAFSGDNPNSLAGLRLQSPGDIAISLGTSDTLFGSMSEPKPSGKEGHIFVNPVDPNLYMGMIVHQNGSLTRESVRDACADGSWLRYGELVAASPVGNGGNVGFYIREPEITPTITRTGTYRFDADGCAVDAFDAPTETRALLESQFLSLRVHADSLGLTPRTIYATGGASVDKAVIRIVADVFGTAVYTGEQSNSASLGSAYRALHGYRCSLSDDFVSFADAISGGSPFKKAAQPDMDAHAVYNAMLKRFTQLEDRIAD